MDYLDISSSNKGDENDEDNEDLTTGGESSEWGGIGNIPMKSRPPVQKMGKAGTATQPLDNLQWQLDL